MGTTKCPFHSSRPFSRCQSPEPRPAEPVDTASASVSSPQSSTDDSTLDKADTTTQSNISSKRTREETTEGAGGPRGDAPGDGWATASMMLLDLSAGMSVAGSRSEGGENYFVARTLASAFAAMPPADVEAILRSKFRQDSETNQEDSRPVNASVSPPPAVVVGSGVDNWRGGARGDSEHFGEEGAVVGEGVSCGEKEGGEAVAHAVAEACRDMVLRCLLEGGGGRGAGTRGS